MHHSSFILSLVCFSEIFGTLGGQYSLKCVNNYLSLITCFLNVSDESLGNGSSNWLHFSGFEEQHDCTLRMREKSLLCELDLSQYGTFTDTDSYRISLHSRYHGNNFTVVLDDAFILFKNIRPNPPFNLSVIWEKDEALFQWTSGYMGNFVKDALQYQFSVYSRQKLHEVITSDNKVNMSESKFEPHTNYTVRVRSQPDQEYYKGVWSLWAPALHWRTGDIRKTPEGSFQSARYHHHLILLLLLLPLLLVFLSCFSCSRWRKNEYIPSPAPYFENWDVDVKMRAGLSGKVCDVMQGEEFLQIDILTESTDTPPQQTALDYESMGMESPSMPRSPMGSEVDSGCWIRDFVATERGSITCSEDYCTLSNSHIYGI